MKLLILIFLPLSASQGYRYIPVPLPQIRDLLRPADREEYNCLLAACRSIRQTQVTIADVRMCVDDCIEASITNYLKNVDSAASLVLLRDLKNRNFRID